MGWERIIKFGIRGKYIPEREKWMPEYFNGSYESCNAINEANKNNLERYLTWIEPKKLSAMSREIDSQKVKYLGRGIVILIISLFIGWFFGYQECRNKAVDFISVDMFCYNNNTMECIKFVNSFKKSMRENIAPF